MNYRFSFVFQIISVFLSIASYYFLARFIGSSSIPGLDAYRGDYFAFVLIGVALHDYLATSLDAFSRSIRESQLAGTREALLSTQTSPLTIILSSPSYPFLWTSFSMRRGKFRSPEPSRSIEDEVLPCSAKPLHRVLTS